MNPLLILRGADREASGKSLSRRGYTPGIPSGSDLRYGDATRFLLHSHLVKSILSRSIPSWAPTFCSSFNTATLSLSLPSCYIILATPRKPLFATVNVASHRYIHVHTYICIHLYMYIYILINYIYNPDYYIHIYMYIHVHQI